MSAIAERCGDPLLDLILQKYMQASKDSIRGPVALKTDAKCVPKSPHIKHPNKGTVSDLKDEENRLKQTNFDGRTLYGFDVGGEIRLCFTDLNQTILKDVNVNDIYKKKDNLFIFTSKCTRKQMDALKYHGILPWTTTSSNLITKSDAYRLCGALLGNQASKLDLTKRSHFSFEVYHECFGGCIGVFNPELYSDAASLCIRCTECNGLFATHKFVSHNHTSFDEVHTCHWGFDSSRWRSYIMLVEQKASDELISFWDNVKSKFASAEHSVRSSSSIKLNQDADFVAYIHSPDHQKAMISPIENLRNQEASLESVKTEFDQEEGTSAFRPWVTSSSRSSQKSDSLKIQSHFLFPIKTETINARFSSFGTNSSSSSSSNSSKHFQTDNCSNNLKSSCLCYPTAPLYMDCRQCKNASHAICSSSSASQKTTEPQVDMKARDSDTTCLCEQCKDSYNLQSTVENILQKYTSGDKLIASPGNLAIVLTKELRRLNISQEEKVNEISIGNHRLQTELQLVKMESRKKLKEVEDTKYNMEKEIENMHRERKKEIAIFTKMQTQLHQSMVDCENLKKQLDFHISQRKSSVSKWTPYPTIARQFSESSDDDSEKQESAERSCHLSVVPASSRNNNKRSYSVSSPVTKSRKLESRHSSKDESSDIEVEA